AIPVEASVESNRLWGLPGADYLMVIQKNAPSSTRSFEKVEDGDLGCVSSPSSGEELVVSREEAVEKQGAGKRRRRRKRKRKKRGSAANAQELQPVVVEGSASPSGASDEVISLASDFGRAEEEEVIGIEEVGELPMASEENPNRTLWRVRRWATEMVSQSSESSMSSDVELRSDLEEDGQQTPRWSADAHGSMSDFLWGLGEGGGAGSSSSSSSGSNDPMEVGATFSAERTVDYMHRLCCAEGQLMRSLANGSNADPRERQTTCPRCGAPKLSGSRCAGCRSFANRETSRWCGSTSGVGPISHLWTAASDLWHSSVEAVGDGIKRLALTDGGGSAASRSKGSSRRRRNRRRHDGG
ncbi:hypothetical protein FOZ63_030041, partial [Perkinsus olseni]